MELLFALAIIFFGVYLGFVLTVKKSVKRKFIVWGLITIFLFTPFLGWFISIQVAIAEGDGFAAVAMMMILFPLFFLIGLILLLFGIFKKKA